MASTWSNVLSRARNLVLNLSPEEREAALRALENAPAAEREALQAVVATLRTGELPARPVPKARLGGLLQLLGTPFVALATLLVESVKAELRIKVLFVFCVAVVFFLYLSARSVQLLTKLQFRQRHQVPLLQQVRNLLPAGLLTLLFIEPDQWHSGATPAPTPTTVSSPASRRE